MGLIERIKAEGFDEGMKIMLNHILDFHSLEETTEILGMDESEILHILEK